MVEREKHLEKDLNNSNADFENLEMSYQNSSCKCDSSICKNCESLQKKVLYLVKTVDTISKGKSNLENVLASKNCVFGNLVWVLTHKAKTIVVQNLFQPSQKIN